jgi:hypothetical protein
MSASVDYTALERVLADLLAALSQARARAPEPDLPDGCGAVLAAEAAAVAAELAADHRQSGRLSWTQLMEQAVHHTYAQTSPARLREALLGVAATSITWIQALDRRPAATPSTRPGRAARLPAGQRTGRTAAGPPDSTVPGSVGSIEAEVAACVS